MFFEESVLTLHSTARVIGIKEEEKEWMHAYLEMWHEFIYTEVPYSLT